MKSYWDSSAVINAAISTEVMAYLDHGEHVTRLHTLAEVFSTMTGRGIVAPDSNGRPTRVLFDPGQCASWLREFAAKIQFQELDKNEVLDALDATEGLGLQGARIYDYWHALVARKSKADELLTRNTDDFQGLAEKLAWP